MKQHGKSHCPVCHREIIGNIIIDGQVFLERSCPHHGHFRTMLFSDPGFFAEAVKIAATNPEFERHTCLVSEVTERCDVGCATCSASSTKIGGERDAHLLVNSILRQAKLIKADVVALSGGEPLMRKDIWEIADTLHKNFSKIVLITSGRGFETDSNILYEISARSSWLEIYLQFDSLDDSILRSLRIPTMTAKLRCERLKLAVDTGAATTAVCIVQPDSTEKTVGELAVYCRTAGAAGITFQPLRRLGRHSPPGLGFGSMSTIDHIQRCALKALGVNHENLRPFAQQPFDITVAFIENSDLITKKDFFLINNDGRYFRVATSSYWDATNYYDYFANSGRYYFYVSENTPLNYHYFSGLAQKTVHTESMLPILI